MSEADAAAAAAAAAEAARNDHAWFMQPDRLNLLLEEPRPELLQRWLHAIVDSQEATKASQLQQLAWHLGDTYESFARKAIRFGWYPFLVLAILVFLQCLPSARVRLHEKDRLFMQNDVNDAIGNWLQGRTSTGAFFGTRPGDSMRVQDAQTVAFVQNLMLTYNRKWLV